MNVLNRVKEQINPGLTSTTDAGRERLKVMLYALEKSTNLCKDVPELWFYRVAVSQRLGKPDSYAQGKLDELPHESWFDPFSVPPAAKPPKPEEVARVRRKWALVVGINEFQDERIPHLHFAVKDSEDFASYLTDPNGGHFDPGRVQHLTDGQATLEGIREGLGYLRSHVQSDDLVVIYISSHGSPREADPNGVSYIVTHDTNIDGPEKLYATSLQMIDLVQQINREIKARRVVLILDTCYSGDAQSTPDAAEKDEGSRSISRVWAKAPPGDAPSSAAFSGALENLRIGYGRAVLTASRANERSWESTELKNGYFTRYLLDALRDGKGSNSLDQIFAKLKEKVRSRVLAEHGASQTPSCEFSEHADSIVLGVAEEKL
jgi:uncharacterized caspase-like protein